MSLARAQIIIPAVTQQPDGPWSRDNSEPKQGRQRQPIQVDFNTYYDENIRPSIAAIVSGNKKKTPSSNVLFVVSLCVVLLGGLGIGLIGSGRITHIVTGIVKAPELLNMLLPLLLSVVFMFFKSNNFFVKKKNERTSDSANLGAIIIPEIFTYLDNGCTFDRYPILSRTDLEFLGIAPQQPSVFGFTPSSYRHQCHDEVVGTHQWIAFKMVEVEIEQEVKSKNSSNSYYRTIFDGVYLLVDVPKPFKGRVDIKRDSEKFLGAITSVFSNMKRVRLEDPEFEKVFQVYSDDQVEARCLMTTTMMQSLNDLRFVLGGKSLEGSFHNGQLALRIDCPHDLFEINDGLEEEEYRGEAKKIVDDLNSIFKAIDAMDLHTQRIV